MPKYKCGHCGYEGYCYGTLIGDKVSAPWCKRCGRNDKLEMLPDKSNSGDDGFAYDTTTLDMGINCFIAKSWILQNDLEKLAANSN